MGALWEHYALLFGDNSLVICEFAPFALFFIKTIFYIYFAKLLYRKNGENGDNSLIFCKLSSFSTQKCSRKSVYYSDYQLVIKGEKG